MSEDTIVAVYDTPAHAELAASDLKIAGIPAASISLHRAADTPTVTAALHPDREHGFWTSLFGGEPGRDADIYESSMAEGSTIITVRVPEAHVDQVIQILESHHPIDIDERGAGHAPAQSPGPASLEGEAAHDGATMQLAAEQLCIGKRLVNRGGARIRRYVVQTQVEEQVTLRDQTVHVERRPVTDERPVADDGFADRTIEMTEVREEAVVSKTARVVEEITLRRETAERVETIRDTVRRDEVDIEQLPKSAITPAERLNIVQSIPER
jgi:uncharacterized protein (TIGR02271 family)